MTRFRRLGGSLMAAALTMGLLVPVVAVMDPAPAGAVLGEPAIISNGTVQLGINPEGELNVPGIEPSSQTGTTNVGLRYVPTGAEATADGCLCEGWGAADAISNVSGSANISVGGVSNLTVESFDTTPTTAVSVTDVGTTLRVTHDYHPSAVPNLYEVTVTIQNTSAATVTPRYRRVMDWDVEPTAFSEFVTIGGTAGAANVLFANDNGFASADPLVSGAPEIAFTGDAVDNGPNDHGALFDFGFDNLAPGGSVTFKTYYGGAATEAEANAALGAVGAEVFSYGQPSTPDGPTLGTPNTFIFAFAGVGGVAVVPAIRFVNAATSVNENAGTATIPVELTAPVASPVTATFATSAGTATPGSDYTESTGTLTIPANSTSGSFTVPILPDGLTEPDETVNLALSNPVGAVLGAPSTAVLTILGSAVAGPLNLVLAPGTATNPVGTNHTVTTTVTRDGAPVSGVPVTFSVTAGPNTGTTGTATSNAAGVASFTYSSATAGTDTIQASAPDGAVTRNSNSVTKTWVAPLVLVLAPGTATNPVNTNHTVTTTVTRSGAPVSGVPVTFSVVSGPNIGTTGTATSNAAGVASFTYSSATAGTDTIQASAPDGSATRTSNSVTKTWTPVAAPTLTATMVASPAAVTAGSSVLYDLTITNTGGTQATGVSAAVDLPPNTTLVRATSVPGACGAANASGVLICTVGTLASGASAEVRVVGTVPAAVPAGGTITATALVVSNENSAGVNASATGTVQARVAGQATGFVPPGGTLRTGVEATPADNTVLAFTLPNAGVGTPITLAAEASPATFCAGLPCVGKVAFVSDFAGYNDPTKPPKLDITWDKTVFGRGLRSEIYVQKANETPVRVPDCKPRPEWNRLTRFASALLAALRLGPHSGFASPSPCVNARSVDRHGDLTFEILLLSGDPRFGRR